MREKRDSRARITGRRWTCSGSACRTRTATARHVRPSRSRQADGDVRSRRLLAMRVRYRERRDRAVKAAGIDASCRGRRDVAVPVRPRRRAQNLGRREIAQRDGRSAERMVAAGLICIGDAAHAMSPIGGVGINMAVQDAVAAANQLAGPLQGKMTDADLQAIEKRRTLPIRSPRGCSSLSSRRVISRVLGAHERPKPSPFLKLFGVFPILAHSCAFLRSRHSHRTCANAGSSANLRISAFPVSVKAPRRKHRAYRVSCAQANKPRDLRPRPAPYGFAG